MPLSITEYIPQTDNSRRPFLIWVLTVGVAFTILGLIVAAPIASATNHARLALSIYRPFGTFCHQLPERSFFIAGHPLAVCARCLGIYGGFGLVLVLYPLIRSLRSVVLPPAKWLFIAATPLFVDFSLTFVGIWENTHTTRLLTGMLMGGVTVFYVMPGLVELGMRVSRKPQQKDPRPKFTFVSPEAISEAPSDYSAPERRI